MNENINLVEILKNAPRGTKLWSPLCGECSLYGIDMSSDVPIIVEVKDDKNNNECVLRFAANGKYFNRLTSAECLLFPSKDNRDWSTFKAPWMHKHFEPFQKVLMSRFTDNFPSKGIWVPALYGYYDEETKTHILTNGSSRDDDGIIPYESNEDKLGKSIE